MADPDTRPGLRLEILRLAHRHDQAPEQVIDRARKLEAYVTGPARARSSPDTANAGYERGLAFSVGEPPEPPPRRRAGRGANPA